MLNDNGIFELTLEDVHFFHARLSAKLSLQLGKVNFLHGQNGAGKSSLFEYFKKNQNQLFSSPISLSTFFISQSELDCLPNMRGADLEQILQRNFPKRFDQNQFTNIIKILDKTQKVLEVEVSKLSGGQAQFLKLAMGLSLKSDIYFIDEPFNNIDQSKRALLRQLIKTNIRDSKKSFFIIDHFYSEWSDQNTGNQFKLDFLDSQKLSLKDITGESL